MFIDLYKYNFEMCDIYVYVYVCYGFEMNLYNLVEKFIIYIEGCKVVIMFFQFFFVVF